MGGALIRCAARLDDMELAAALDRADHPGIGRDSGETAGAGPNGVPLESDPRALERADVLVDFSLHSAVPEHVRCAHRLRRAMVIGATGLDVREAETIGRAAQDIPIVWAPNMSLAMNLMFAFVGRAAATLGSDYAIEIDETHHVHKKDAPSGTALRLGEKAAAARRLDPDRALRHDAEGAGKVTDPGRIVIRSHRRGEVVGDHTVGFGNAVEQLELTHHAWSRDAFAGGALHAARWVVRQRPRLYDMQDVLGL